MKIRIPDRLEFIPHMWAAQRQTDASLQGKLCVISGATSGVGLASLRRIAAGGADVVLVARNAQKAEDVRSRIATASRVNIDIVIADFTDLDSVRNAAAAILEKCPRIDLLVNSAGVFSTGRVITAGGFELCFCVNHLAPFLLTRLLLDRIAESAPARIIQVNSQGHRFGGFNINDVNWQRRFYNGYRGYGASKIAQLLTIWEMADRLGATQVTVNAVHPGGVKTNIGNNNGPLYRWFSRHVIWYTLKDPGMSGDAIYFLAAAPEVSSVTGRYFNRTVEERPAPHARDRELGRAVWELSERLVGLVAP
ncbi:MAG: SDR family NAD(P)-dependent oxidoreductase [Dehalococcoidia bacterium]|nr:MAG: SDR family NAD(P)-dependent oxidoreductase [Dehalococcoidia bacterium]